jgi:hypothetical protein
MTMLIKMRMQRVMHGLRRSFSRCQSGYVVCHPRCWLACSTFRILADAPCACALPSSIPPPAYPGLLPMPTSFVRNYCTHIPYILLPLRNRICRTGRVLGSWCMSTPDQDRHVAPVAQNSWDTHPSFAPVDAEAAADTSSLDWTVDKEVGEGEDEKLALDSTQMAPLLVFECRRP